jgi:hypothetical protein
VSLRITTSRRKSRFQKREAEEEISGKYEDNNEPA